MKISTKGRYGLRALVDMAANTDGKPMSLTSVAKRQCISLNYLEQVFGTLRKSGIVTSTKGSNGGYLLKKPATDITVREVLQALEGEFTIVERSAEAMQDPLQQAIQTLLWDEIDAKVNALLEMRTLEQLVNEYKSTIDQGNEMFYI
ncbi:MAG: Rrf2 family transcriptional regulator [Hespellia sp.]|nr:Rrf2 family transcriptional regulator [Hespellia sp.]